MKLIIKTYETMWTTEVLVQEDITSQLIIDYDLITFDVATFSLPASVSIEDGNRIEIYEAYDHGDKRIFGGYVFSVDPIWMQFDRVNVTCRSWKAFLNERKALAKYTYSGTITSVLTQLLSHYNTRGDDRLVSTTLTDTVSLTIEQKDLYMDAIDDLIRSHGYQWSVVDGVITIAETIGQDYSTGDKYQEVFFNNALLNKGNIKTIDMKATDSKGNILIAEDVSGTVSVDESLVDGYVTGVVVKTFREGNLAEKKAEALNTINKPQRTYTVTLHRGAISAEIGDKIRMRVEGTNKYYDIDTDVVVIGKQVEYKNNEKYEAYTIGEFVVAPFTYSRWMYDIEKQIGLLKL